MKITFCIILLAITCSAQAQGPCNRDTIYYQDGKINRITDFDTMNNRYCGIYIEFDSLGSIIMEGHFEGVDSVICSDCYTEKYGDSTSKWQQYKIAKYANEIRVGKWEYFHPTGILKEVGMYCKSVHEYTGMTYPFKWGNDWPEPVNGYITFEYLKDGLWEYYDINGDNILTEEYSCGHLVHKTERSK